MAICKNRWQYRIKVLKVLKVLSLKKGFKNVLKLHGKNDYGIGICSFIVKFEEIENVCRKFYDDITS